jgi:hypothetical protein
MARRFRLTVDVAGHGVLFDLDRNERVKAARAVTVIAERDRPTRLIVELIGVEVEVDLAVEDQSVEEEVDAASKPTSSS